MKALALALIQQTSSRDFEQNIENSVAAAQKAAAKGAKLIVLHELFARPYFCQVEDQSYFDWAETIPGPTTERFAKLARELKVVLVVPLFEKRGKGLYHNTAVVLEQDGSIAGIYRKMHIPDDPGYYEKYYFTPGDLGFTPIKTSLGCIGVLICWDQWYPEGARLLALAGADIIVIPTAIGWAPQDPIEEKQRQHDAWETIQRAHAIANHVPVAVCNRVGLEADIQFWGQSFVTDTMGKVLAKANSENPETLMINIDLGESEREHRTWPFFRDRRIDHYGDLVKCALSS